MRKDSMMGLAYVAPGPMELLILLLMAAVPLVIVLVVIAYTRKKQAEFERRQADQAQGVVEAEMIVDENGDDEPKSP
jgi:uncharacterized membrane protein